MKDWNHDLVHQLSEDLDSFWRYEDYMKNAQGCEHCQQMWHRLQKLDEEKIKLLRDEITRHVKENRFD